MAERATATRITTQGATAATPSISKPPVVTFADVINVTLVRVAEHFAGRLGMHATFVG